MRRPREDILVKRKLASVGAIPIETSLVASADLHFALASS